MAKDKTTLIAEDWQHQDPFRAREIQKYGADPLPSREYILSWLEDVGRLVSFPEILTAFGLDEERGEYLHHRIKAMTSAGQLMRDRQGNIGIPSKMDLVTGTVIAHPEGYGFLSIEGEAEDGFIPPQFMGAVMHGDKVLARVNFVDRNGRKDYVPVEILERGQKRVVGRLNHHEGIWTLIPENKRLTQPVFIPENALGEAKDGQIVVVEIVSYPTRYRQAVGQVVEILGERMAPGMEVQIAIENYDLPHEFPESVVAECAQIPDELQAPDYKGRVDLRDLPLVTIDGITSRDFDDAVCAIKRGDNYVLYVAIADVAHYVKVSSPLDTEAYLRGTSVYFPDRVIPMLPEKLSNGLCSLNPDVDRLCIACELTLSPDGKIKRTRFHEAVMHSHARLTYETAEKLLFDEDELLRESYGELTAHLDDLKAVYQILHTSRINRHTIDFDLAEPEFIYDSEGKIETIQARSRLEAHKLIEECMVIANVAAARFLSKYKLPGLYRVHDDPSAERMEKLKEFLGRIGIKWQGMADDKITPQQFANLLEKVEGRPDYDLIEKMVLRSMAQAIYSADNRGHFGLALQNYAHFTSPIRRYPDLLVHRAIRHKLRGGTPENYVYSHLQMTEFGKHCSDCERRADEATRDAMDFLKCEFMSHHLGEEFTGKISNVTSFGFFVTLDTFYIDGLIHISTLTSDYYHFDANTVTLTGEHNGKVFKMLDNVKVRVAAVSIQDKKIDFELLEHNGEDVQHLPDAEKPKRKPRKRRSNADKPAAKSHRRRSNKGRKS